MKNLPTDLLRAYVTVVREKSFSMAAKRLSRSQPAVSLQINRLEALVNVPLMLRKSRSFSLTEEGEVMLDYAQRILRLNDEALLRLKKPDVIGKVRFGIPNEFAISYLPNLLAGFTKAYPGVELEVVSELSQLLIDSQSKGNLDVVVAIHREPDFATSEDGWREKLVWIAGKDSSDVHQQTVPLVVAPHGCVYRYRMLKQLDAEMIPWRIVYTGTSYGGICAAVTAGLGVTVMAESTVPLELMPFTRTMHLPPLDGANVDIHYDREHADAAVLQLVAYISQIGHQTLRAG